MNDDDEQQARIAQIRARLGAATPGPWQTWPDGADESVESASVGRFVCHMNSNMRQFREDASLIANAPADLAWLLAEVERLEAERVHAADTIRRLNGLNGHLGRLLDVSRDTINELTMERDAATARAERVIDGILSDLCDMEQDDPDRDDAIVVLYEPLKNVLTTWIRHGGVVPPLTALAEQGKAG